MKKSKLLLSLAMMCLSIAVLCFGVLAATSVTYTISGTISYEVSDVFVKINTSVYAIAEQQDKATVITTVKAMESKSQADSLTINSKTYTRTQEMVEYDSSNAGSGDVSYTAVDNSDNTKGIEIVYGTYYTYYIVINIQNLSASKAVDAIITDNTEAELNSIKTTNLYQNNIASTETKNIVIAYSIKDKTSSITNAAISYSLKVSYEDTDYTDPITITSDTTNNYYYVTLGSYSSSPIKWKLVSLDGVNRYTYNSSHDFEGRYLSGAIFVQETYTTTSGFNSSTSAGNTYSTSLIRTFVTTPRNFGLTEFPSYVASYTDTSTTNGAVNGDKFWLLSKTQADTFFADEASRKFYDGTSSVYWWLRTPDRYSTGYACLVDTDGCDENFISVDDSDAVRAAFQLA